MAEVIRWEAPPEKHGNARRAFKLQPIAEALRGRPGEWAVIAEGQTPGAAGGLAHRIKHGIGAFAPPNSYEARCVGPAFSNESKVYARYVGEGEAVTS